MREHEELVFAQSRGVDVSEISNGLPTHLQLEVFFHLNLDMLKKAGLDPAKTLHQAVWAQAEKARCLR